MGRLNGQIPPPDYKKNTELLNHFSHAHPLQLLSNSHHSPHHQAPAVCNACARPCVGAVYYACPACNYFLDETCARTPQSIRHPGHPDHILNLLLKPSIPTTTTSSCDACGGHITASSFSFRCSTSCDFDLHISCANSPLHLQHHSHPHSLALTFGSPYGDQDPFSCDICGQAGGANNWLYRCEPCGFDAHIGCAASPTPLHQQQQQPPPRSAESTSNNGDKDPAVAMQLQMMAFGMQQAALQNQAINNMAQSHHWRMATLSGLRRPDFDGSFLSGLSQNMNNLAVLNANLIAATGGSFLVDQAAGGGGGSSTAADIKHPDYNRLVNGSSSPEEFLTNLLKESDLWGGSGGGVGSSGYNPSGGGNPEEFLASLLKGTEFEGAIDGSPNFGL